MQEIAKEMGGRCLSLEYVNNKNPLLWKCKNNHQWMARPDGVIRGTWCIVCAGKAKYDLQYCKKIAKQKQGECISDKYINCQIPMEWKCSQGHTWKNSFSGILNAKQWCPYCYGNVRHTIEEMKKLAKKYGGECLSNEYNRNKIKLKWKCNLGHVWEAKPNTITSGHWCKKCGMKRAGMKNRFSLNELHRLAENRGGKLLSQAYRDGKIKLCWLCADNHEFKMTAISVNQGQWCPECSSGRSERICRKHFEGLLMKPFPKSKPKWLISSTGKKLELDGYNEELKLAFEYQGIQHYSFVKKFHKKRSLQQQKDYDILKRHLCAKNGVILIEIPYTVQYNGLKKFIIKRLNVNNIPIINEKVNVNPLDFYSPKKLIEFRKIAELREGICISGKYVDGKTKLRFKCKNNHEWEATPKVIKRGNWCSKCVRIKNNNFLGAIDKQK